MKKIILTVVFSAISVILAVSQNPIRVGLVLSGGGALGYAHVGVIKALEEHGISPQYIAGTSMGAIVGVLYADGFTPDSILKIVKEEKLNRIRNLFNLKSIRYNSGASSHRTLTKVLNDKLSTNSFEKLQKHYYLCVTDLDSGNYKIVGSGSNLSEYVVASSSIPGVFETEIIDNVTYVDGGTLNNFPAQALQGKCDVIIGVDVLPFIESSKENNTAVSVVAWSIRLMQHQNSLAGREICNFVIEPTAIKTYNEFSFQDYQQIFQNGYDTTNAYLDAHPELILKCGGRINK